MDKNAFVLSSFSVLVILVVFAIIYSFSSGERDNADSLSKLTNHAALSPAQSAIAIQSEQNHAIDIASNASESAFNRFDIDQVLNEVNIRLRQGQTDEALNELNALLEQFDNLSDEEQERVLISYATYFTRLYQFKDARFFYEAALELPGMKQSKRLAIIQLLARFAAREEDWNAFLAYNERYFEEGGEYNFMVTGSLINAYRRLGDLDAAGQSFKLQLETGIDPTFDGSEAQYHRMFGENQYLPLEMSDTASALELAQQLIDRFNRIENWKVLADIYERLGDQSNLDRVVTEAHALGFLNSDGDWLIAESVQ